MAKGSKSKKTKSKNNKTKNSKKTNTSKMQKKEEIKKEPVKEIKEVKKEEPIIKEEKKVIKEKTRKKKKIITRNTILLFLLTLGFLGLMFLLYKLNNSEEEIDISYISQNKITISSVNSKFKAPVYFYTLDKKNKQIEVEGLEFVNNEIKYSFNDYKKEDLDDDNILITIPCDMELEVEYDETDDVDAEWHYDYDFLPFYAFDYYTGDVYLENIINDSKYTFKTKLEKKDKKKKTSLDEMKDTEITSENKKISVGILKNIEKKDLGVAVYQGRSNESKNYKGTSEARVVMYIKAPKDYDGLMLAINKKGMSKELFEKEDKEVEAHKLISKDDNKDDFYVISVSDMFNPKVVANVEEEPNFLYIFGMVALVLATITSVAFIVKEIKK